jgi:hypothetical protein
MERELAGLRSARERENGRAAAEAQQANLAREASIRSKRLEAGSRFNIRFKQGFTADATTPAGVMRALAQYADFGALAAGVAGTAGAAPAGAAPAGVAPVAAFAAAGGGPTPTAFAAGGGAVPVRAAAPAAGPGALRKGMTLAEVEAALGPAATAAEAKDGSMTVTRRTYRPEGLQVTASFVAGVLVDYAITPR